MLEENPGEIMAISKFKTSLKISAILGVGAFLTTQMVAADDTAILGTKLTPLGANPAASASGDIPAWTGGLTKPPTGYTRGEGHIDPFADDKMLFSITAANAAQYKDRLMAGQTALLERHPKSYRMDIYPSRRSCANPQFVYDATRENARNAKLVDDGNGIEGAHIGVPFPIPKQAVEIYWNHNFHWYGHRYSAKTNGATVYPNGDIVTVVRKDLRYNFYADPQRTPDQLNNKQFLWMGLWSAPSRFNGAGFSMTNTINQVKEPRKGFMFRPDLRKIIRATPSAVTYDGPLSTSLGLRNNDNMFLFSGAPDRYTWKLLGKKEIYIPYNAYRASQKGLTDAKLMTPNHLDPDYLRYELHRVWVVEVKSKPGLNVTYGRRVFYADEDSWIFVGADLYNTKDELVRVQHAFVKNYYEMPACVFEFDVMHDLKSGRYNVDHLKTRFGPANLDADVSPSDFGSAVLKRKVGR